MAFTSGTATDYHDLLDDLRTWAVGTLGWTQLRWTAPSGLSTTAELWIRGPGSGASRQSFVGIESRVDLALPAYGWAVRCSTGYDGGLSHGLMPNVSPEGFLNLLGTSMDYWFYGNDRRIIVVARCSTSYVSLYAGMLLPLALPDEFPFPIAVIGSNGVLATPQENNSGNRFIADPGEGAGFVRDRNGVWRSLYNHERTAGTNEDNLFVAGSDAIVWPHRCVQGTLSTATGASGNWTSDGVGLLRPNVNDETPLIQCHVMRASEPVLGALDGVFATSGFGRSSEQVVTSASRDFMLFQNIFRATPRDFMAIEEA